MVPPFPFQPNAPYPVVNIIRQARKGVARRRADEVAEIVGLTNIEMAKILNMSVRGLHGKSADELLNQASSERLLLLERLIQHGLSVFDGDTTSLGLWLRTPLKELAYRATEEEKAGPISIRKAGGFVPSRNPTDPPADLAHDDPAPQPPLSILDTVVGFSLAEDVLGRIEWGIIG
ncbi:antitoxin Xre-like helix-turn-helix domain-containing protein [Persicitalea jodogahamensis]|uniref:Antitoxin Xre-like helix-turn-helix domain-containing protein n=1 Tax=Persicitalea jodogahamensis TaxID=402147 RepID=A0A8J3G9S7_9BACT|nr:antitoxin Xre-like helix-turn-helix domain-containing protein [Persicitalea jodogahamensis]GHB65502.1 hypothetical protein GCM10007390_19510 [Persicitalea jodogahamensis]